MDQANDNNLVTSIKQIELSFLVSMKEGLTCIVDRLQVLDKDNFEALSGYIDIVIPIIIPETILEKRIKLYHDFDIQISTGSTITELSILKNYFDKFVKESKKLDLKLDCELHIHWNGSLLFSAQDALRFSDDIGMTWSLIISTVQKYGDTNTYGYAVISLSALNSQGLF